jgi:hypothetical protein
MQVFEFLLFLSPLRAKRACPDSEGNSPTAGLTLLWARNPFRENSKYCQISQLEAARTMCKLDCLIC